MSQLLALPDHLLSPPALVFEVFLCGVRPTDCDPDWPPQVRSLWYCNSEVGIGGRGGEERNSLVAVGRTLVK